ncbi:hypothetical protein DCS_00534 [Drechmeria coniospora]|uniref:Uncharacterized protein n=1 Tax=Drechmeria coniospora TaxID=98403 RepID=A0A151GQK4_DRECN|nr:hypothetical protein DCS_00534 [Drechmeria coniospora]KYK59404.1 hypothetical protein DCS_00534 [Drechmeria coniospora]
MKFIGAIIFAAVASAGVLAELESEDFVPAVGVSEALAIASNKTAAAFATFRQKLEASGDIDPFANFAVEAHLEFIETEFGHVQIQLLRYKETADAGKCVAVGEAMKPISTEFKAAADLILQKTAESLKQTVQLRLKPITMILAKTDKIFSPKNCQRRTKKPSLAGSRPGIYR